MHPQRSEIKWHKHLTDGAECLQKCRSMFTAGRKYWRRAPHCGEKGHYNYSRVVVFTNLLLWWLLPICHDGSMSPALFQTSKLPTKILGMLSTWRVFKKVVSMFTLPFYGQIVRQHHLAHILHGEGYLLIFCNAIYEKVHPKWWMNRKNCHLLYRCLEFIQ